MSNPRTGFAGMIMTATLLAAPAAHADVNVDVDMHKATKQGQGEKIGTITLEQNRYGVLITTDLTQLDPGPHGFHLHENPDCGPKDEGGKTTPAGAAGGHYDPEQTDAHRGPYDPEGHLGDLPRIYVGEEGEIEQAYLAPRLELTDFLDRALVIHEGGDNYADEPQGLGGGGARVACGVVPDE